MSMASSETLNMVEDHVPSDDHLKMHDFPLARQPSIYSLTLDEFQHTLCEPGKNFGSMNMDEFLANIWTAEESQAVTVAGALEQTNHIGVEETKIDKPPPNNQTVSSLHRQGSFSLPAPLCSKTVDEVWSEIHREQPPHQNPNNISNSGNPGNATRQPTFGEMTLEDFLIKAGVVREGHGTAPLPSQYGLYQNNSNPTILESDFSGHGMSFGGYVDPRNGTNGVPGGISGYQAFPQQGGVGAEGSHFGGNGKTNAGFQGVCFGGRMGNGGGVGGPGGFGAQALGSPVSPVSSDGVCTGHMDNAGNPYGVDVGGMRGGGRKRIVDGPVEKVVERRQRRMIKNRESAARSRARKQAYTVELEAELEQLKEENTRLKKEQEEAEERRRRKLLEIIMATKAASTVERKSRKLRRTSTGPW
ncbi:protein ABSCISIC ACID-INSENSITIVE 5-like [Tasmannia lanceolata]|uniref:protein ABSCISIC ACID-INSENSITIVE 5-like n=1 Tax=Tasmannia lanceolata TaxID=3420 RepID=UPI0040629233